MCSSDLAEEFENQISSIKKKHDRLIEEKKNVEQKMQANAFSRFLWKHIFNEIKIIL